MSLQNSNEKDYELKPLAIERDEVIFVAANLLIAGEDKRNAAPPLGKNESAKAEVELVKDELT